MRKHLFGVSGNAQKLTRFATFQSRDITRSAHSSSMSQATVSTEAFACSIGEGQHFQVLDIQNSKSMFEKNSKLEACWKRIQSKTCLQCMLQFLMR